MGASKVALHNTSEPGETSNDDAIRNVGRDKRNSLVVAANEIVCMWSKAFRFHDDEHNSQPFNVQ